jgi:AraC-like DNA-binding protein
MDAELARPVAKAPQIDFPENDTWWATFGGIKVLLWSGLRPLTFPKNPLVGKILAVSTLGGSFWGSGLHPHVSQQASDGLIAKCQAWLAEHYAGPSPVGAMAKLSGLPERTFIRRFVKATGLSPLEYVHVLRLEEAKQMLETEEMSIEAIAEQVGYEDASFFGRLFRRKVGLTPAQYRLRFGSLRRALHGFTEHATPSMPMPPEAVPSTVE